MRCTSLARDRGLHSSTVRLSPSTRCGEFQWQKRIRLSQKVDDCSGALERRLHSKLGDTTECEATNVPGPQHRFRFAIPPTVRRCRLNR